MNLTLFFLIIFLLQAVCLIAGSRAAKGLRNQKDYFLASKEVKFFPLLMTFVATQVGGGLILGSADEAYHYGWLVLLYPLGACLGFVILASGIGKKLAQFQVSTVAQLFEVVYQSTFLKKLASLLSISSLFFILVAQVIASKKFMMSLGATQIDLFILVWLIIILYTVLGGLKAVVSIDIIQALFFITIFCVGFLYILLNMPVSIGELFQNQSSEQFIFEPSKLSGWLFMPLLFMVIEQDMAQRCFAAKSPRVVSRAAAWAALLTLAICVIPVLIGVLGKNLKIEIVSGASTFMTVTQILTNPTLSAFIGCAVMMAIISTAISLLNAVSSNLMQDFKISSTVQKSRWMTALIGIAAVFISFYFNNIVDLLIQSYELSVYCLFVPVFIALFKPNGSKLSAGLAMLFGMAGFFIFRLIAIPIPKEILSVLFSALGYSIGEMWGFVQRRQVQTVIFEK